MFENSFHHVPLVPNVQTVQTLNTLHSYSLEGENLLGGTPFVEQADLLTAWVEGVTPEELWELVAMSCLSNDVPVSWNAGATGLPVCKAGCSVSGNIVWKLCWLLEVLYSCMFFSLLWVSNSKWEGSNLGLIIWQVLLRMESSGNLTQ